MHRAHLLARGPQRRFDGLRGLSAGEGEAEVRRALWRRHVDYLNSFLRKSSHADIAENLHIGERLVRARKSLEEIESPDYLKKLAGTLGAEPVENYL